MLVGVCEYQLFLPNAHSLKEKRALLKSLQARLRNKFPAAVCEAEQQELWQRSTLGVAVVGNQQRHVESMLASITEFVEDFSPELELLEIRQDIL